MASLAPILQRFFTDRMITQRHASQHTIAAYRDTFRLLLSYAQQATGTPPWKLELRQLDAQLITGFLQHLQYQRRNSARTRNARLAAIRALYRYASLHAPEDAEVIQQVLAIDGSRTSTPLVTWLNAAESTALLAAAGGRGSWTGRRDYAMLLVLLRTGLRVSELTQLNRGDVHLGAGAHVRCLGKGRKERCTPLDEQAVTVLRDWLAATSGHDNDPLFPSTRRGRLTRDAVAARLTRYHQIASQDCPSLAAKAISPHTLRHSLAMELRRAGVDVTVLALWLGHSDIRSTQIYVHADLEAKERALALTSPPGIPAGRYQPSDPLLAFLESL
jgi:site-specific recombinase XerD